MAYTRLLEELGVHSTLVPVPQTVVVHRVN